MHMGNPLPFKQQYLQFQPHNPPHVQPQSLPTFRAPAHKHAHHLHSIPPREKSTRTLIIDHMLSIHARTRFAQARAELGMTDPTGGPLSSNYKHRRRPENYDEDEEALSESEDILYLNSRSGWPGPTHDDDDADHLSKQDLSLARSLRLRAEGLESVITAMLDQPPPHHTTDVPTAFVPPTSPKSSTSISRTGSHPHTLPNGVRLRLALGTVINDLFARQAPPQPYRHTHPPKLHEEPHYHSHPLHHSSSDLPEALLPLLPISGASLPASLDTTSSPSSSSSKIPPPPPLLPSGYTMHSINTSHPHTHHLHTQPQKQRPTPCARTISYYATGADPTTGISPASLRCPRHLHTSCEICVETRSSSRPTTNHSPSRVHRHNRNSSGGGSSSNDQWRGGGGGGGSGSGGGIAGWHEGSGIGSGLLRPGLKGSALRRRVYDDANTSSDAVDKCAGAGNTKLSKLIPRFLRLSALVAAELGQEARDGVAETDWDSASSENVSPSSPTFPGAISPGPTAKGKEKEKAKEKDEDKEKKSLLDNALRPTREWYMLLAGLLTRAVLEGYLTAGWRGRDPAECLLLVGIDMARAEAGSEWAGRTITRNEGVNEEATGVKAKGATDGSDDEDDDDHSEEQGLGDEEEFVEFDPDGLPSLAEAVRVLFPSLRVQQSDVPGPGVATSLPSPILTMTSAASGVKQVRKGQAEEEYETEMYERLRRFYDIPNSTPDLATHMEDLAWSYPAEPVERAAVRFCEAVAKWRGKPELETYKKKPPSSPGMSIDSLVHSNPTSPVLSNAAAAATTASYSLASLGSLLAHQPQPQPPLHQPQPPLQQPQQQQQGGGGLGQVVSPSSPRPRRQARKPSIDVYFSGTTGLGSGVSVRMTGGGGVGGGVKRMRDREDDEDGEGGWGGREEGPKRVHLL